MMTGSPLTPEFFANLQRQWKLLRAGNSGDLSADALLRDFREAKYSPTETKPLVAELMNWLILGLYPPPELLAALLSQYWTYLRHSGELSLEEVLIGKSVRKGGNYAARSRAEATRDTIALAFVTLDKGQQSLEKVAETVVRVLGLEIDAASALRMVRDSPLFQMHGRSAKRKNKARINPRTSKNSA